MHPIAQTHKYTDGHLDSMTESAQWGRFSENSIYQFSPYRALLLVILTLSSHPDLISTNAIFRSHSCNQLFHKFPNLQWHQKVFVISHFNDQIVINFFLISPCGVILIFYSKYAENICKTKLKNTFFFFFFASIIYIQGQIVHLSVPAQFPPKHKRGNQSKAAVLSTLLIPAI